MFFLWWLRINLLKGVIYDTINTTRHWKNNTLFFLLFLILVKTIYRFPGLRCHSSKQKALMKYKSYWHCFCLSFYFLQKRFIFGSCLNYGLPLRQRYQSKLGKHVYFLFLDTHKKSNIKKELTLLFHHIISDFQFILYVAITLCFVLKTIKQDMCLIHLWSHSCTSSYLYFCIHIIWIFFQCFAESRIRKSKFLLL